MKTIYLIEPLDDDLEKFKEIKSIVDETDEFELIRTSIVSRDEALDYSELTIPKPVLNRFNYTEQSEFQKLTEDFSKEKTQKRLFYDLIKKAFGIDVSIGGLFWITPHPLGLQIKFVYTEDFLKLDMNRRDGFLLETLDEIDSEFLLSRNSTAVYEGGSTEKLSPREIADAIGSIDNIDSDTFKYLSDKLMSLGLRVKLNPKKIKLIIKDKFEGHKVFISGIQDEIKMTPLQKSFYFLILLFEDGVNITGNLNSKDYQTYNDVWVNLYTKLKSCDPTVARQRIDNLCGDQQKLSSEKTRTNRPFKKVLKKAYPVNFETLVDEFIVRYDQYNVKLMIELARDEIDNMDVVEALLSGELKVR